MIIYGGGWSALFHNMEITELDEFNILSQLSKTQGKEIIELGTNIKNAPAICKRLCDKNMIVKKSIWYYLTEQGEEYKQSIGKKIKSK